ncbi:FAD-dependent oxidoreductase [Ramlibacter monticola]|uniref:FAD-dependent oxidoreductase n=1 Tax=Ramlibacter monticola TaxID=1926872 RepID=A0A936YX82_9BURK|nr:FAD-dependent oxidoreductase [Ramlibacter monticola]MBL0390224.1 FAD-dependent oxidoreductase [Ramlibacter monticola]
MTSADAPAAPTAEARRAQMFPILSAEEIARMHRFGQLRDFSDGDPVLRTGRVGSGVHVVLSGALRVTGRDGHGHDFPVVEHGSGNIAGELAQLSGRPALVDAFAVGETRTLEISPAQLHAVLIAEAALGEKLMRAMILRRVALIEAGAGGPVLIGSASSPDVARLQNFLRRNGTPHVVLEPSTDRDAQEFVTRYAAGPQQLPLVVCPNGDVLRNPSDTELARCIGMLDMGATDSIYDVAIVGAGPAGLAAAVYASSEGLSVLVIDARSPGGQAGASARIENYLGFPTGISGQALAGRAYTQALKFDVRMLIPAEAVGFDCLSSHGHYPMSVHLGDGRTAHARAVVVATGARYRRPECRNLQQMEGRGVWYWASPIEARMCAGEEVVVVGGGNSAGQAAVFLSSHASMVWMLVRGPGLAASMSKYLIDRIAATQNIQLLTGTQIAGLEGTRESGVTAVTWRSREPMRSQTRSLRHVFLFLGADPCAEWLRNCAVAVDDGGFVTTAHDPALPLQTSVPGVFAIGDVRAGSVKRVGGAIGEGAAVVAQIHQFLGATGVATTRRTPTHPAGAGWR